MEHQALQKTDPQIFEQLKAEIRRQHEHLELIASENFVSEAVLEASGSEFTNKYAEGYPGKRYYGGCEHVDVVEDLARERMKKLFGAEHANVQPHSGSNANLAVYLATLKRGDKVLGMKLNEGGHLTHGSPVNISGLFFEFHAYGVDESERIDYEEVERIAKELKPRLIIAGASAYPREIDFAAFRKIADEVGALLMVDMAHIAGLIAAGLHDNPVPYADFVTTTTHKTLRGPRGGAILCKKEYAKAIDKAVFPGLQGGPLMHVIAGKAVCFEEALQPAFNEYMQQVKTNAAHIGRVIQDEGVRLVSGGTDNHLLLLDVSTLGLTGKEAEERLARVNITTNKNTIPKDQHGPNVTSGVRIGTAALTTRGMREAEMTLIGTWIVDALRQRRPEAEILADVLELAGRFPLRAN